MVVFAFWYETCIVRFLEESPRWLMVRGHQDRALHVLQKAARWNNVSLPPKEQLLAIMEDIRREVNFLPPPNS